MLGSNKHLHTIDMDNIYCLTSHFHCHADRKPHDENDNFELKQQFSLPIASSIYVNKNKMNWIDVERRRRSLLTGQCDILIYVLHFNSMQCLPTDFHCSTCHLNRNAQFICMNFYGLCLFFACQMKYISICIILDNREEILLQIYSCCLWWSSKAKPKRLQYK